MSENSHLVCPNCNAINRIPEQKLESAPKCGKCQSALFQAKPLELSAANFARHISRNDIPVLVDFWAPWCGPCKTMAPAYAQAAGALEPKIRVAKVNTEAEQSLGAQYGIRSIPTLALFKEGKEIARQAGAMSASDIERWVTSKL